MFPEGTSQRESSHLRPSLPPRFKNKDKLQSGKRPPRHYIAEIAAAAAAAFAATATTGTAIATTTTAAMSDAGSPDVVADALGAALGEREQFPMHEECVATLTMKCGSPQLAVRKKLHDEIAVPFVPEEGFAVFQTKVERHFAKLGPIYVQEKRAIYMKPSSNATQSKYLLLTKDNFEAVLRMRWKIAKSMKTELKYEVFCYFVDTTSKKDKRRRLLQQQAQQLKQLQPPPVPSDALLLDGQANAALLMGTGVGVGDQAHSFLSFGPLSGAMQGYADVAASLVESAGAKTKSNTSSRQADDGSGTGAGNDRPRKAARVAARQPCGTYLPAAMLPDALDESFFVPIPFRINGVDVPIEIDIAALRRSFALLPPARLVQPLSTPPLSTADGSIGSQHPGVHTTAAAAAGAPPPRTNNTGRHI